MMSVYPDATGRWLLSFALVACVGLSEAHAGKKNGLTCKKSSDCTSQNCVITPLIKSGTSTRIKVCAVRDKRCGWPNTPTGTKPLGTVISVKGKARMGAGPYNAPAAHVKCMQTGWEGVHVPGKDCKSNNDCLSGHCPNTAFYQRISRRPNATPESRGAWTRVCAASGKTCGLKDHNGKTPGQTASRRNIQYTCMPDGNFYRSGSVKQNGQTCDDQWKCVSHHCAASINGQKYCAPKRKCSMPGNNGFPHGHKLNVMGSQFTCNAPQGHTPQWLGHSGSKCGNGVGCGPMLVCGNGPGSQGKFCRSAMKKCALQGSSGVKAGKTRRKGGKTWRCNANGSWSQVR